MMDRLRRAALLTRLIEKLHEYGSWTGETHVQKSALILQDVAEVPLTFEFVLYKHGPFSFDLRDELTAMRADGLIELRAQRPYGPRIVTTERSKYIQSLYSKTLGEYDAKIAFVAEAVGAKGVVELERLATAIFLSVHWRPDATMEERVDELTRLKPHVSREAAIGALGEGDQVIESAREYV